MTSAAIVPWNDEPGFNTAEPKTAGSASRANRALTLHVEKEPIDRAAGFEALLAPVLDAAYRAAYQFTRNPADAEDLVQEASLLAFRAFHTFEPGSNFRAWFLRILTNAFYTSIRRAGRRVTTVSLDDSEEGHPTHETVKESDSEHTSDPATLFLRHLDTAEVTAAIQALPEEFRTVATLYFIDDVSYQEISQILGIPVGTVRSRLHRGRRVLKDALLDLARERGIVKVK